MNQVHPIPAPLPVIRIIRDAFRFVWGRKFRMVRALLIPAVAVSLLKYSPYLMQWISSDPRFYGHALFGWLSFLLQTAIYALCAITCHRLALIGDSAVPDYGLRTWTKREWRYLGWALVILIIWMLYSFVINSILISIIIRVVEAGAEAESFQTTGYWIAPLYIPLLYILSRLSVLYPAIAVDRQVNAQWAWQLTVDNGWRLTVVVGLLPWVLYFLVSFLLRNNATWVEQILFILIGFVLFAVEVVALSFSYKHLAATEA